MPCLRARSFLNGELKMEIGELSSIRGSLGGLDNRDKYFHEFFAVGTD
jgi:hypothetical protein